MAKIRKYALGHHLTETASAAWEKVFKGAKGQRVTLNNEIAETVVRQMGGFRELGMSENAIADRAHFMRMYDAEVERRNFIELAGV